MGSRKPDLRVLIPPSSKGMMPPLVSREHMAAQRLKSDVFAAGRNLTRRLYLYIHFRDKQPVSYAIASLKCAALVVGGGGGCRLSQDPLPSGGSFLSESE